MNVQSHTQGKQKKAILTSVLRTRLYLFFTLGLLFTLHPVSAESATTFAVNSTADAVDESPGNSVCDDGTGNCTLRAAIQEMNALSGADTITLPAGTYTPTIPGQEEQAAATGDLDIKSAITINGAGASTTVINANEIDRVDS